MKNRLTTLDIVSLIKELQASLLGLRVDQIYDIDKKTYLIRLTKTDVKKILVLESGVRFHTTTFEWPKNAAPSGFTMKMRKHLNNKRLESITQIGADRIVDFQFGTDMFTHHVLLELYDRGNMILTDYQYNILSLLRPRIVGEERLASHETYSVEKAKQDYSLQRTEVETLVAANGGKTLREIFLSKIEFGPALFTHVLKPYNLLPSTKIPPPDDPSNSEFTVTLFKALEDGRLILENFKPEGGFITLSSGESSKNRKKKEQQMSQDEDLESQKKNENSTGAVFYDQFHPNILLTSFLSVETTSFSSFDQAVDDFFSKIESQKLDMKQMTQEREALQKLEKVKLDQLKRLDNLKNVQEVDKRKAELISVNQNIVDAAISAIRKLVANQIPWTEIWEQIQLAKSNGDPLATTIVKLNLIRNQFTIALTDPYETPDEELNTVLVDIDLDLSAYANATKYYDLKKQSAKKEERTLESQDKAIKSTEKRTIATLKEVATLHSIKKARKVYWFEKFRWFISSENYLVLGGRDAQQNELLVKRYLKRFDAFCHADTHGAPTIIIKNDVPEQPILPKTLNEAGCFAVAQSGSWDTKVVTSCWWVWGDQVSKSAPTGEYLPTGSFMVRGKKNYLPPTQLVLGFGFLFRLTDESIEKHRNERTRRLFSTTSVEDCQPIDKITENLKTNLQKQVEKLEENLVDKPNEDDDLMDEFPDTQVKLKVDGVTNRVRTQTSSTMSVTSDNTCFESETLSVDGQDESQNTVIINSGAGPINIVALSAQKIKRDQKRAEKKGIQDPKKSIASVSTLTTQLQDTKIQKEVEQDVNVNLKDGQQQQKAKRGQHGRNKKLKEKYRDQDEEDRELRMRLIRGGESGGGNKKGKGKGSSHQNIVSHFKQKHVDKTIKRPDGPPPTTVEEQGGIKMETVEKIPSEDSSSSMPKEVVANESAEIKLNTIEEEEYQDKSSLEKDVKTAPIDATVASNKDHETAGGEPQFLEEEEEEPEGAHDTEKNLLNSLTGAPQEDDELLYAVPVVAPYSTLQSYKYKLKMVPGTAKRGKAARSALELFFRDKSASPREKDLLKSIKDQDLARNFPGKVKMSTGHDKR